MTGRTVPTRKSVFGGPELGRFSLLFFSFGVSPYAREKAIMRKTKSTETSEVDHKLCNAANTEVLAVAVSLSNSLPQQSTPE